MRNSKYFLPLEFRILPIKDKYRSQRNTRFRDKMHVLIYSTALKCLLSSLDIFLVFACWFESVLVEVKYSFPMCKESVVYYWRDKL
jgi:hypothetical protein